MSEAAAPQTEEERQSAAASSAQAYRNKFAANADDTPAVGDTPPETPVETPTADAPVKPEGVPDKFWDAKTGVVNFEAWGKSHSGLEARFHQSKSPDGESEETPAADKDATAGESPDDAETQAILETPAAQKAADSYAANGQLSDEDYAGLEKQGITRDMIDTYIAGKEAAADRINSAAYEPAGGEEQYTALIAWAAENLDEASKLAFNSQLQTGNPDVIRRAVTTLAAEYSKEATIEGDRVGGGATSSSSNTFASRAEMTQAINELDAQGRRKYDVDPAYRNEVARKIGASRKAKTINF